MFLVWTEALLGKVFMLMQELADIRAVIKRWGPGISRDFPQLLHVWMRPLAPFIGKWKKNRNKRSPYIVAVLFPAYLL